MDVCGRIIPINQTWFANIIIIMCHSQAEVVVLSIHVDPTTPRATLVSSVPDVGLFGSVITKMVNIS